MIRTCFIGVLLILMWLVPPTVAAADEHPFGERTVEEALSAPDASAADGSSSAPVPEGTGSRGLITALLNMVAALALVLAILYIVYRFFLRRQRLFQPGGIRHVAGYALGPQKSIQLLEIGGKIYVLGVAEDVRLLRLIDDPEETEKLLAHLSVDSAGADAASLTAQLQARLQQMQQQRRLWLDRLRRPRDAGDGEGRG